ncbi:hypothetical protein ALO95_200042 [Pseudomonas syringae pv. antirrhini]|nr:MULTISPECIES: MFS transporter [Pseudomonas]RMP42503.1 hypothetical protein ALQ23_200295 [Pseudomonas syringae pv. antirrhini]RMW23463.1 hypothetical protein ALO95_200042 [Pseudomonas syringae pv. antirrhini]WIN08826.1 MFS transporter [Pseudomonas syringae pv. antirrhini str. 126]
MTTSTVMDQPEEKAKIGSAVGSMALCVAMLISSEFLPMSLLTPIADDLGVTQGMAGQAISVCGLFALLASLIAAPIASYFNRKRVLLTLTALLLVSLLITVVAPDFLTLMLARAILGLAIGAFWTLSTATVMQLVPVAKVPIALSMIFMGNAMATAFSGPIGAYVGEAVGWRTVFGGLIPIVLCVFIWQAVSLPNMKPGKKIRFVELFLLIKRRYVVFGMLGVMLSFSGALSAFTYFRPFLETETKVDSHSLSLLLLGLGLAGFVGTRFAGVMLQRGRLYPMLRFLPGVLAVVTLLLAAFGGSYWIAAAAMVAWGALWSAIPVCWSTWLGRELQDHPESGGGLMIASIQLSIMLGGAAGGHLLDTVNPASPLLGGSVLLILAALVIGNGNRLKRV